MQESGTNEKRIDINYFDGTNSQVSSNLAKKVEFTHTENARSKMVGSVEKREGQVVVGTAFNGAPFVTEQNYSLFYFESDNTSSQGLYRISGDAAGTPPPFAATMTIDVAEEIYAFDVPHSGPPEILLADSYSESNVTVYANLENTTFIRGQSFAGTTGTLSSCKFFLKKTGNPVGMAYAKLYAHTGIFGTGGLPTGAALATSDPFDVSTLSTSAALVELFFSAGQQYSILTGTNYCIELEYSLGTINDYVGIGVDDTTMTHPGNGNYYFGGAWLATTSERIFYVYVNNPAAIRMPYVVFLQEPIRITEIIGDRTDQHEITIYYLNSLDEWIPMTGSATNLSNGIYDVTRAERNMFIVNAVDANRYITSDGTSVISANDPSGHLFNSPVAHKVQFYKSRLYLGDYTINGVRYPTSVIRSSYPMGIIALVTADTGVVSTYPLTLELSDTKYLSTEEGANKYTVYRGNTRIMEITAITSISDTAIVIPQSGIEWIGGATSLESSDELWIKNTWNAEGTFRWPRVQTQVGQEIKQYDTFKLSGDDNSELKMLTTIGNVLMVSNNNLLATWNDYTIENFDLGIGCVSRRGYVKTLGTLYFLHYSGVYSTSGGVPQLISTPVERYITGATRLGKEASAAGKKGRSVFFTLGDVTLYNSTDGSYEKTMRDVCLEYNIIQSNWYVHTNIKAEEFETFIESADQDRLTYIDMGDETVTELFSGNTDKGDEIFFRVDLPAYQLQDRIERLSNVTSAVVEVERGHALEVYASADGEPYYKVPGVLKKGVSIVKITPRDSDRTNPPLSRKFSISIRDSSKAICKITQASILYLPTTTTPADNEDEG